MEMVAVGKMMVVKVIVVVLAKREEIRQKENQGELSQSNEITTEQ